MGHAAIRTSKTGEKKVALVSEDGAARRQNARIPYQQVPVKSEKAYVTRDITFHGKVIEVKKCSIYSSTSANHAVFARRAGDVHVCLGLPSCFEMLVMALSEH